MQRKEEFFIGLSYKSFPLLGPVQHPRPNLILACLYRPTINWKIPHPSCSISPINLKDLLKVYSWSEVSLLIQVFILFTSSAFSTSAGTPIFLISKLPLVSSVAGGKGRQVVSVVLNKVNQVYLWLYFDFYSKAMATKLVFHFSPAWNHNHVVIFKCMEWLVARKTAKCKTSQ